MKRDPRIALLLTLIVLVSGACAKPAGDPSPQPAKLQPGDLKKLAWIEGSWRGTGTGIPPFFERYRFDGDSALVMEAFADEGLTKVTRTGRYELKNGQLQEVGDDWSSVATELTDTSVTFEPLAKGNPYKWVSKGKDAWTAILEVPANGGKPASQIVYQLERWTPPTAAPAK